MKYHSAWLAAALLLAVVLACNLSKNSNNRNTNENTNRVSIGPTPNRPANADVYVDEIHMAKDKDGDPGDEASNFEPGDHTIHCVIKLNKAKGGTKIKFTWKAIDVTGMQNGDIRSIDYATRPFENTIHAHLTYTTDWPKGSYQVDVYINGVLDKQVDYTIQ